MINSGDVSTLYRPNCQNGIGIFRVIKITEQKYYLINFEDVSFLYRPNCQKKDDLIDSEDVSSVYTDPIVNMVSVSPD